MRREDQDSVINKHSGCIWISSTRKRQKPICNWPKKDFIIKNFKTLITALASQKTVKKSMICAKYYENWIT